MGHQGGRCGARFNDRTTWRQVAAQDGDTGFFFERLGKWLDNFCVVVLRIGHVLTDGFAVRGHHFGVQEMRNFFHHRWQSTCVAEVFHQVLTGRLEIDQARQFTGQAVEVVDAQRHAQAACNRHQVDHGIGTAANRSQSADRILERFACQDLRELHVVVHHLHNASTRFTRQHIASSVHGWIGRISRQAHTQGFDHAGHGARGAHRHAVAVATVHAALGFKEVL